MKVVLLLLAGFAVSLTAEGGIPEAKRIIERKRERKGTYVARPVLSTKDTAELLRGTYRLVPSKQEKLFANETVDNRMYDTPIRNQGAEGLCTSFAVVGAVEFLAKKNALNIDLSEKHLWMTYQVYQTANALAAARANWITSEQAWPYASSRAAVSPLPRKGNVLEYRDATTWDDVYASLREKRGVILSVVTNTSWSNPRGGVLSVNGQQQGGHAIAVSGYFDTSQGRYLIIKNSWGPGYGSSGYVFLPEAYCASYWCAFHVIAKAQVTP